MDVRLVHSAVVGASIDGGDDLPFPGGRRRMSRAASEQRQQARLGEQLREELPAETVEGIYLVDPTTNEARYLREDGIGAGKLRAPQAAAQPRAPVGLALARTSRRRSRRDARCRIHARGP